VVAPPVQTRARRARHAAGADHPDWGLVVANPKFVTLAADVEQTVTLDSNYAQVEVALVANAAPTYFNTSDTAIGTVSGTMDGNHAVSSILVAKIVQDGTSGQATIVHLRSSGIPTVSVCGL
jgi:hypothetical protein